MINQNILDPMLVFNDLSKCLGSICNQLLETHFPYSKPSPCFENDNATLYHLRFFFFLQYTNVNILCYSACTTNHYRSASKDILQPQQNHAKRSEFSWNPNAMEPQKVILSNSINRKNSQIFCKPCKTNHNAMGHETLWKKWRPPKYHVHVH